MSDDPHYDTDGLRSPPKPGDFIEKFGDICEKFWKVDVMSDGSWDEATVRECARRVFDCQMRDPDNENPLMRIACANQALLAYDKLMRMIEPDRDFKKSIEEVRPIAEKIGMVGAAEPAEKKSTHQPSGMTEAERILLLTVAELAANLARWSFPNERLAIMDHNEIVDRATAVVREDAPGASVWRHTRNTGKLPR